MAFGRLFYSVLDLFLPEYCPGCGQSLSRQEQILCIKCMEALPETRFHLYVNNPVAQKLTGRIKFESATSCYYFQKSSIMQNIIHQFKYKDKKEAALFMGRQMGGMLKETVSFASVQVIVPVPLHLRKQKTRGYNQSALLANGIAEKLNVPVCEGALKRQGQTQTQTRLSATGRWQNVEKAFILSDSKELINKHVLLVDDVITSGATLEACTQAIKNVPGIQISIATLAMAEDK